MAVKTTDQEVSIPDGILKKIKPAKLEEVPLNINREFWVDLKRFVVLSDKNTNLVVVVFYCCDVYNQFHWPWTCFIWYQLELVFGVTTIL